METCNVWTCSLYVACHPASALAPERSFVEQRGSKLAECHNLTSFSFKTWGDYIENWTSLLNFPCIPISCIHDITCIYTYMYKKNIFIPVGSFCSQNDPAMWKRIRELYRIAQSELRIRKILQSHLGNVWHCACFVVSSEYGSTCNFETKYICISQEIRYWYHDFSLHFEL